MNRFARMRNTLVVTAFLACGLITGYRAEGSPSPDTTPGITYVRDPANPSNVQVTVTFKNPVKTGKEFRGKPIFIRYDSAALYEKSRVQNPTELELGHDTNRSESTCRFSLPVSRVNDYTLSLRGYDTKPVGEADIVREIELNPPDEGIDTPRQNPDSIVSARQLLMSNNWSKSDPNKGKMINETKEHWNIAFPIPDAIQSGEKPDHRIIRVFKATLKAQELGTD